MSFSIYIQENLSTHETIKHKIEKNIILIQSIKKQISILKLPTSNIFRVTKYPLCKNKKTTQKIRLKNRKILEQV